MINQLVFFLSWSLLTVANNVTIELTVTLSKTTFLYYREKPETFPLTFGYNGIRIINLQSISTILIGGLNHSQMGGLLFPIGLQIPSEKVFRPQKNNSRYSLRRCLEL